MIAGYGLIVPKGGDGRVDHVTFLHTLSEMRRGAGYYPAYRASFRDYGIRLGGPRSFRFPGLFLLWRWIPPPALYAAFLIIVVGGTAAILLFLTRRPLLILPVVAYLLLAGRTPGGAHGGVESWLLVEEWAAPLIAGCLLAWQRQRWWWAAGLAAAALLMREITLPLLAVGLVASIVVGHPRKPWLAAGFVGFGLFGLHSYLASTYTLPNGNEAALFGTGHPPSSVLGMTSWEVPGGVAVGFIVWALAAGRARHLGLIAWPAAGLLAIPLSGLLVDRPYWGLVVIPLAILWAAEELTDLLIRARASLPWTTSRTAQGRSPLSPSMSRWQGNAEARFRG